MGGAWRRRTRGDPPRGQRDVRGQARRRRPHGVLRREPPHATRVAAWPGRARAARRRDPRRARDRVPAGVRARDRRDRRRRGAAALGQPRRSAHVSPAEFIPVAEDTGSIVPIGALGAARELRDRPPDRRAGRAAGRAVGERVRAPARPSGLRTVGRADPVPRRVPRRPARRSRSPRPRWSAPTRSPLARCTSSSPHGIRIVLDDFGTGVVVAVLAEGAPGRARSRSTASFVGGLADDFRDQAIVSSLVGMARALGCTVTAEGVETDEQLAALRALECERVQGFLLARPMPAAQARGAARARDNVVAIQPPAATTGPADPRQTARTRHHRERAPGQSHRPAVLRLPASR